MVNGGIGTETLYIIVIIVTQFVRGNIKLSLQKNSTAGTAPSTGL